MKQIKMAELVGVAKGKCGPISEIVVAATHGPNVRAHELAELLATAGYELTYQDAKNGAWAWAHKGGVMCAQGYAGDRQEALLYAALGAVREEEAAKVVEAELAKAGVKVDERLRLELQTRFITGGKAQLAKDMEAFAKAQ